ncbi:zinc-finger domain-containing protein [Ruegeria atlantica]|uniref:zinc-finger domain-containing protein n=1 Tax=Ruegeria atlantica TaxID=81569 RepID=UPI00147DCF70
MTIEAPETKVVESARDACDGAVGRLRLWLQIPEDTGLVECPHCDCKYVLKGREAG